MDPTMQEVSPEQLAAAMDVVRQYDQVHGGGVRTKDVVSGTPNHVRGHGVNGLFAVPGVEKRVINAMAMPLGGLLDALPSRTSTKDSPLYEMVTGVTAGSGSERNGVCDTSPQAGLMKTCLRSLPFGLFSRDTRVINIRDLGRQRDRSDFLDYEYVGNPLRQGDWAPAVPGGGADVMGNGPLRSEIGKALFEFGIGWVRDFAPLLWTANPTNNTPGGGYKEPYGLDYLINDGYQDAIAHVACPAADSLVRDWGSRAIESNGVEFVQEVAAIIRFLEMKAKMTGLSQVAIELAMREELFWSLSEIWACAYYVSRCATSGETIDAKSIVDARDAMRAEGQEYLLINGKRYRVHVDQTLPETAVPGSSYKGTIYFLPMRILNGQPATFIEYLDQDRPDGPMVGARLMAPNQYYTSNNGRYLWHWRPSNNGCIQGQGETEWRVVVETPHLAARLDNVKYTPRIHTTGWDPDYSFYSNGGQTNRWDNSYWPPIAA